MITDYFSKWVIFPLPDATAQTCADRILNKVIARFGCPYGLHYDQGSNFHQYWPGDYVWYRTHIGQLQGTPKLRVPYSGPFVVLSILGKANFQIQLNSQGLKKVGK